MNHSFNIDVARRFKKEFNRSSTHITKAVLVENIAFWIKKNANRNMNGNDGYYWTWESAKSFQENFDYMSEKMIQLSLLQLEKSGIIKSANYNKCGYDRTKWYTIVDEEIIKIYEIKKCKMDSMNKSKDSTSSSNGKDEQVEPIPDINTDINTDKEKIYKKEISPIKENVEKVYKNYPSKCIVTKRPLGKNSKNKEQIKRLLKEKTVEEMIEIQELYTKSCKSKDVYMKNYSTFLNQFPDKDQYVDDKPKEVAFDAKNYRKRLMEEAEENRRRRERGEIQ